MAAAVERELMGVATEVEVTVPVETAVLAAATAVHILSRGSGRSWCNLPCLCHPC